MAHFDDTSSKAESLSREDEELGTSSGSEAEELETVGGGGKATQQTETPADTSAVSIQALPSASDEKHEELRGLIAAEIEARMPKKGTRKNTKPKKTPAKSPTVKAGRRPQTAGAKIAKENKKYKKLAGQLFKVASGN